VPKEDLEDRSAHFSAIWADAERSRTAFIRSQILRIWSRFIRDIAKSRARLTVGAERKLGAGDAS
jgi:hypothetical protein